MGIRAGAKVNEKNYALIHKALLMTKHILILKKCLFHHEGRKKHYVHNLGFVDNRKELFVHR